MKDNFKLLIVGRTGSGKDYLARLLTEEGLSQLISYTTRPKRTPDEDTHIFITKEEADSIPKADKVATTVINGYEYFATRQQVEASDIYIIDPNGLHELMGNMPDTPFLIINVRADREEAKKRAMARGADPEKEAEIFEARYASESEQFTAFEKELESKEECENRYNYICMENDYRPETFDDAIENILNTRRAFRRTLKLVRMAKSEDLLYTAENKIRLFYDNDWKDMSEERFAMEVMNSAEGLGRILRELIFRPSTLDRMNGYLYDMLDAYIKFTGLRYDVETEEYLSDVPLNMGCECMAAIENAHADLVYYLSIKKSG